MTAKHLKWPTPEKLLVWKVVIPHSEHKKEKKKKKLKAKAHRRKKYIH